MKPMVDAAKAPATKNLSRIACRIAVFLFLLPILSIRTVRAQGACSPLGAQSATVLLANFNGGTIPPDITQHSVQSIFFSGTGPSVQTYFSEASYGKMSVTGNASNWFNVTASTNTSDYIALAQTVVNAAVANGISIPNPNFLVIVVNGPLGFNESGLNLGAHMLSTPNGSFTTCIDYVIDQLSGISLYSTTNGNQGQGIELAAHEMGHAIGLDHAGTRDFNPQALGPLGTSGTYAQYTDNFDAMGNYNIPGHYSAPHKALLGWIAAGTDYLTVQTAGTYTIQPYELGSSGLKAIKVQRGAGNNDWLWIEYRQPVGFFDPGFLNGNPHLIFNGALIHYEDALTSPGQSNLVDFGGLNLSNQSNWWAPVLNAGQSWYDPYTNLSLTVASATAAGLTVQVSYSSACPAAPLINIMPTPAVYGSANATSAAFSVNVTNPVACSTRTYAMSSSQPAGWATSFSSSSFTLGPGQAENTTLTKTIPAGTPGGSYPVDATATVGASAASAYSSVVIDTTLPTVSITSPANGATVSGTVTISATASDNVMVQYVWFYVAGVSGGINAARTGPSTYAITLDTTKYANGQLQIQAQARDEVGNSSLLSAITINVNNGGADTTPPTIGITSPANGATVSGAITVSGTAADNVSVANVQVSVDGGAFSPASGTSNWIFNLNTSSMTNASHTITAKATDTSGNTATSAITVTVNNSAPPPDTTPPTIAITLPANGATVTGTVSVTGTAADNVAVASVMVSIDGGAFSSASGTASWSFSFNASALSAGSHTVAAKAADKAGNTATASITVNAPDTIPPTVSITSPTTGSNVNGTISISATASDNVKVASVQFLLDGSNLGSPVLAPPYTTTWNTSSVKSNTSHTISAKATDTSGNTATSASVTVKVTQHLSAKAFDAGLREAYCYPNPALQQNPTVRAFVGAVNSVEITIFDQSGAVVNSGSVSGAPTGDNGTDVYYDYPIPGRLASGIYFAVIHAKAPDGTILRARAKCAVIQ